MFVPYLKFPGHAAEAFAAYLVDAETGEPAPRVRVRADLWARIARPVFYELVEQAEERDGRLFVRSGDEAFELGAVA